MIEANFHRTLIVLDMASCIRYENVCIEESRHVAQGESATLTR